jgi:F-type H+-transporting ATPase subunit b
MEIVSNIALITINGTLFHQLIAFLIFLFVINRIMFRPLQNVMGERESFLEKIKQDTNDKALELERLNLKIKTLESNVREEAFEIGQELEEKGSQEASAIIASTMEEIGSIKDKIEAEVNAQIDAAKANLKKESEALAVDIMEKLLDRRLVP